LGYSRPCCADNAAKEKFLKHNARRLRERHPHRWALRSASSRLRCHCHEAGCRVKPRVHRCKYVEPITTYACDVLLPTGLYGPLYIWLLRKGREQLVYRTLLALKIID